MISLAGACRHDTLANEHNKACNSPPIIVLLLVCIAMVIPALIIRCVSRFKENKMFHTVLAYICLYDVAMYARLDMLRLSRAPPTCKSLLQLKWAQFCSAETFEGLDASASMSFEQRATTDRPGKTNIYEHLKRQALWQRSVSSLCYSPFIRFPSSHGRKTGDRCRTSRRA
ncbi:hypothetical protein HDV57DRAFT_371410 [Trichoderma longibrachiatum]